MKTMCIGVMFLVCAVGTANSAIVNEITGVSIAFVSSEYSGWTYGPAVNTINGSGFDSSAGSYGGVTANIGHMWQSSDGDSHPVIAWDMGAVYNLDQFFVWNHNYPAGNMAAEQGLKNVDIYTTTDSDYATATWTLDRNVTLRRATYPAANGYSDPDVFTIGKEVRMIKMYAYNSYQYSWGAPTCGLSEVKFSGTAVPEPMTLALLGLGSLLISRRK